VAVLRLIDCPLNTIIATAPAVTESFVPTRRSALRALGVLPAALSAWGLGGCASADDTLAVSLRGAPAAKAVAPFSSAATDGSLPPGWQSYVLRRDLPPTNYQMVSKAGRAVLQAQGRGVSSGLQCAVDMDPRDTPMLRWQWRADAVPPGMSVRDGDTDDCPARIVVTFDGDESSMPARERGFFDLVELVTGRRLPFATLMYVWDGQAAIEEVVRYERSTRIQYLVVESGAGRTGQWLAYERNVWADFQRVFGEPPPGRITNVGVLTDSDDLKVDVQAWYGDIGLFPV
jgi:Protein of unknown function (DUF3047)